MAKQSAVRFDRELKKLFADRIHALKSEVRRPGRGKAPMFNRKKVDRAIQKLQYLAEESLLQTHAIQKFKNLYDDKRQWHFRNKGRGIDEKQKAFKAWYVEKIAHNNCVYIFWNNRKCLYVGRTVSGTSRPHNQFKNHWISKATRVDIYSASKKRDIPKLECLATHRFHPSQSKIRPAKMKWASKCPICETRDLIRDEIRSIFRIRG